MKLDEIRKELQQLNTTVEDLSKRLSELYGEELPQEPAELSKGLRFNIASASFSEEEQKANEELQDTIVSSMRLDRTLSEELSAITRAQQSREQYTEVIDSGADLVTLYKETEETLQQAQTISETLGTLSRGIQNIACSRYFNSLTHKGKSRKSDRHRAILAEIDAIGNGTDTQTADGEKVRTGGFAVIDSRGDSITNQLTQLLDSIQAVNLLCYYNNGFYELHYSTILPTRYKSITADKQRAFIRETIEPCFKSHLEAVKALHFPTAEADKLITKAVEDIYSQLNIVLDTGSAENVIQQVKRNPVKKWNFTQAQATDLLFTGQLKNGESKQITIFDKEFETDGKVIKKPVNTYLSASYKDMKGIIGLEDWTPEQEEIYNAIASEYKAGNYFLTNQMIYKTMLGGDSSAKLPPKKDEEITQFIESASVTRLSFDNSEYAESQGKDSFVRVKKNALSTTLLEKVSIDGKTIQNVWHIDEHPVANLYAESIGQGRDIDIKLLQTGTGASYSTLQKRLLREIDYMKKGHRSHRILLDTLFGKLYKEKLTRPRRQRIIDNAEKMLSHWIRENHIYSYEIERKNNTAVSIRIYLEGEKYTTEASKNRHIALKSR